MKITRIEIKNFRGIAARGIDVGPAGFVASGKNGAGKTSIIRAIRAALNALDVGPDAIRHDADRAEILIDMGDAKIKRTIGPKSSSVSVTAPNGFKAEKPQKFLTELVGSSALDPIEFFLAKPKERRAQILAVLPVTVTIEQLGNWVPGIPADTSVEGHGLEVVGRLRQLYYDRRTVANKDAEAAAREHERVKALVGDADHGDAAPLLQSQAFLDKTRDEARRLEVRAEDARTAIERTASSRERIAKLREEALALNETPEPSKSLFIEDMTKAAAKVELLKKELAHANDEYDVIREQRKVAEAAAGDYATKIERATTLTKQADELSAALKYATAEEVPADEMAKATARVAAAEAEVTKSQAAAVAAQALAAAKLTAEDSAKADAEAGRLDKIVLALTNDAPRALLAECKGIDGLTIDGDSILLDGVALDGLCGEEQLTLATEIARRANAKSKILVVDGLERLDPDQLDVFIRSATRDDFQLLATRVDRGEVVIEAIEPEQKEAAAE